MPDDFRPNLAPPRTTAPVGLYETLAALGRCGAAFPCTLREHTESHVACQWPESILQSLWNEQLVRGELTTGDGRRLRVIHPGVWNDGGGPDFRRAIVEIDDDRCRGDIEIHRHPRLWFQHGHHEDPQYSHVVLHVVLDASPSDATDDRLPPCLVLRPLLSPETLGAVEAMAATPYSYADKLRPGGCSVHLAAMTDDRVRAFLQTAGLARFRRKSRDGLELLLASGTEQGAYVLLMDALGYRANREPFRHLAGHCTLATLKRCRTPLDRCAMLFGCAGLLQDPTTRVRRGTTGQLRALLGELWDRWWRLGIAPAELEWHTAGVRPANRPATRLFAAWRLLEAWSYRPLDTWWQTALACGDAGDLLKRLRAGFDTVPESDQHQCIAAAILGGHRTRAGLIGAPLGRSRCLDTLCNVVLPLLHANAQRTSTAHIETRIEEACLALPRLQGNRTFREMGHRLLMPPGRLRTLLTSAVEQQGLISVYRDFCEPGGGDCSRCPLSRADHVEKLASRR